MALTEAELAARRGLITSSIVAGCLGLDKRCTPLQAALRARGESEDTPNTKACERGDRLEALCLDSVAEERGWTWRKPPLVQRHDAPWAGDSCDAIYINADGQDVALGEAKTASLGASGGFGEEGTDDIPHTALLQSQWHLWHYPHLSRCYVPVLVGGYRFEFRTYVVTRDDELIRYMVGELEEFHRLYVAGDGTPPVSAGDTGWLSKRWPIDGESWTADSPQLQALVKEKLAATEEYNRAEQRLETAKNRIKEHLRDTQGAKGYWGSVYYRRPKKGKPRTDWESVANELAKGEVPEKLIMDHTRIVYGARSLRVYAKQGAFDVECA